MWSTSVPATGQAVGGAVGTERLVAPDARAELTIATMRARQLSLSCPSHMRVLRCRPA